MIWILAQDGTKLVLAASIVMQAGDSPPRYELWAQANDAEWRVATYASLAQAEKALQAIVWAAKNDAKCVDLRSLDA